MRKCGNDSAILRLPQDADSLVVKALNSRNAAVCGCIVDNNQLIAGAQLRKNGSDLLDDEFRAIVNCHANRYPGAARTDSVRNFGLLRPDVLGDTIHPRRLHRSPRPCGTLNWHQRKNGMSLVLSRRKPDSAACRHNQRRKKPTWNDTLRFSQMECGVRG